MLPIMERAGRASGPLPKEQLRAVVEWAERAQTDATELHGLITGRLEGWSSAPTPRREPFPYLLSASPFR